MARVLPPWLCGPRRIVRDRGCTRVLLPSLVARDGCWPIVSAQGFYSRVDWPVTIFTAGGDPIRTIVLPAACRQIAWTGSLLLTHTDYELIAISADGTALWRAIIGKSWKDAELFAVENGS